MSSITLIQHIPTEKVAYAVINEFENVLLQNASPVKENPLPRPLKLLFKLGAPLLKQLPTAKTYFAILMGVPHLYKTFPYFLYKAPGKGVYIFDCWQEDIPRLIKQIKEYRISRIFISAKQLADSVRALAPNWCRVLWLPEAIDPQNGYQVQPKTTDVIQFGRKYRPYHEQLLKSPLTYVHEKLPTHQDFCTALAKAKISICFPSSLTHPERSGTTSTMTVRYLQSMLSKCLIVGKLPDDMRELFDYQPIIDADLNNPVKQIAEILRDYNQYQPLIERNYRTVLQKHTWSHRVETINRELFA